MSTIEELKKEYSMWADRANALEEQYKEAHQNAESIQRVINLMKGRVTPPMERTAPVPEVPGKYKNMTMTAAVFDILKAEKNLSMDEIYQRVIAGGFISQSQTLKRDVATKLSELKKKGSIGCGDDKPFRYYLISETPTRRRRKNQ